MHQYTPQPSSCIYLQNKWHHIKCCSFSYRAGRRVKQEQQALPFRFFDLLHSKNIQFFQDDDLEKYYFLYFSKLELTVSEHLKKKKAKLNTFLSIEIVDKDCCGAAVAALVVKYCQQTELATATALFLNSLREGWSGTVHCSARRRFITCSSGMVGYIWEGWSGTVQLGEDS